MARRYQISLRLVLLAVFIVALALGLLRLNIAVVHSVILAAFALVLLGAEHRLARRLCVWAPPWRNCGWRLWCTVRVFSFVCSC